MRSARGDKTGAGPGTAFALTFWLAVVAAQLGTFTALASSAPEAGGVWRWVGAGACLLFLSLRPAGLWPRGQVLWRIATAVVLPVQVAMLVILSELGFAAALAGFGLALQGFLLSRSGEPAPAVAALALAAMQALLALGAAPGTLTLISAVLVAALIPAAATLLHAGRARQRVFDYGRVAELPSPERAEVAGRARYALGLSVAWALATLLLAAPLALAARIGWLELLAPVPPLPDELVEEELLDERGAGASEELVWASKLGFGGQAGRASNDPVAWVRARRASDLEIIRDGRPMWLKALTLDTFTESELRQLSIDQLDLRSDGQDGLLDGWVRLSEVASDEDLLDLRVHQSPLRVAGAGGDVLLYGEPAVAMKLPRLRYHADRAMVSDGHHDDWFGYRILTTASGVTARRSMPTGFAERASHPAASFLQLPPPSRAMERIEREARVMVRGARTDAERVSRLIAVFTDEFDYSLEGTGFSGLNSVVAFLDRREGYCTSFASTSVLMLRSLGIPARAAVGYLITDWDEQEESYVVRMRHAHAWIEVHFPDAGWVPFDPTPADGREDALARADGAAQLSSGIGAWGARLAGDVRDVALARGGASARDLLSTVAAGPTAVLESARRRPALAVFGFLALWVVVLFKVTGRKGARRGPLGVPLPGRSRAESFWERILIALEDYGFHPRPAETPREFAAAVVARGGAAFAPLAAAAELLYRARWGGEQPSREDRRALAQFLKSLRR